METECCLFVEILFKTDLFEQNEIHLKETFLTEIPFVIFLQVLKDCHKSNLHELLQTKINIEGESMSLLALFCLPG